MNSPNTYTLADINSNKKQHCDATESLLLRKVAVVHQNVVATAIGLDKTLVSRIFSGDRGIAIHELGALLGALGLAITETDGESVTISRERYESLRSLARDGI